MLDHHKPGHGKYNDAIAHFIGFFAHKMTRKLESVALKLRELIFFVHLLNNSTTQEVTT